MLNDNDILTCARRVFDIESQAIASLAEHLDGQFVRAVQIILASRGRVIVTGIGKSGVIGQKLSATLSSTGTPSFFLHPAEARHGDLGMVTKDDVVICFSKSGTTNEISAILPALKKIGVSIITLTGNRRSSLAEQSDVVLDVHVATEACVNDLAPTASAAAMLAMGDALAIALLEQRGFQKEDFAFLHPGGALGRQFVKIDEIMFTGSRVPAVDLKAGLQQIISEISTKRLGGTCVVDETGTLAGIITDGDIRRLWNQPVSINSLTAAEIMNPNPKVIRSGALAINAFKILDSNNINQIIVVDEQRKPVGMIHLHDLLDAGIGRG
ncbi:KpsF/GutQ family sugar-phosphate isomerase [candidate division KSB1 bacterium]|nr:KpsF/GutQ family sugar-phosphate isomerase [candidate division KSB1 bacterium]RQW05083.1 MAG: KpsF/GutQ family sugar-phosphate isomerase [candidate division KSB1 bacterium]